ncbi:MAG: hypothetical protein IJV94_03380 [Bacilli bacterium]|nr:hypothetical protein [Bacilli bacterium]
MFKIFKTLLLVIWIIDICNINFIFNGIEVAEFLDETVAINFWGWFLFWLLVPTSSTIIERSK